MVRRAKKRSASARASSRARKKTTAKRSKSAAAQPTRDQARAADPLAIISRWNEDELNEALRSGRDATLLQDYFGANQYQELRVPAQQAALRSVRGGDKVFVLPGIMGSHLGVRGDRDDTIWLDPFEIAFQDGLWRLELDLDVEARRGERAGRALTIREQRELVREFVAANDDPSPHVPFDVRALSPSPSMPANSEPQDFDFSDRVTIGRERSHRIEIDVVFGDITQVDSGCYVLGLFKHVAPGGAAGAFDRLMGGAIGELAARRMLAADIGQVTVLPKGRHPLRADNIAFIGLGAPHDFNESTHEILGENLIRTFALARVDDFALVPFGGSSQALGDNFGKDHLLF